MREDLRMDLKGLSELNFNLKKIGSNAQLYAAEALVKEMVKPIRKAAKKNVPVRYGTLKKAIRAVKRFDKARGIFRHLISYTQGKGAKYDGWYGRLVELGTDAHSVKKGIRKKTTSPGEGKLHPGAKPHPWLRPAFDENWRIALDKGAKKYKSIVENIKGLKGKIARYK